MAPKRKSPASTAAAPAMPSRVTRSMAAGKQPADAPAKKKEAVAVQVPPPAPAGQKGRKKAKKEEEAAAVMEEVETLLSPPPAAKGKGKKNAKKEVAAAVAPAPAPAKEEEDDDEEVPVVEDGKRVVVEACNQCQQFKKRAAKVKEDLESAVPGVSVIINPEKPRRGCLEIREEGGEVFVSLLNMPRPFTPMRELDLDKVTQEIIKKIS